MQFFVGEHAPWLNTPPPPPPHNLHAHMFFVILAISLLLSKSTNHLALFTFSQNQGGGQAIRPRLIWGPT